MNTSTCENCVDEQTDEYMVFINTALIVCLVNFMMYIPAIVLIFRVCEVLNTFNIPRIDIMYSYDSVGNTEHMPNVVVLDENKPIINNKIDCGDEIDNNNDDEEDDNKVDIEDETDNNNDDEENGEEVDIEDEMDNNDGEEEDENKVDCEDEMDNNDDEEVYISVPLKPSFCHNDRYVSSPIRKYMLETEWRQKMSDTIHNGVVAWSPTNTTENSLGYTQSDLESIIINNPVYELVSLSPSSSKINSTTNRNNTSNNTSNNDLFNSIRL